MSVPARIDFGWIGQGWSLFKTQSGVWIGAVGLAFVINLAIWTAAAIPTGGLALFHTLYASLVTHRQVPPAPPNPYRELLLNQSAAILTAGLGAVLTGGLYRMALQQRRGEPISVFGIFSALPESLSLFMIGIVVPAALGLVESVRLWPQYHLLPISDISASNGALVLSALLNGLLMFAPFLVLGMPKRVLSKRLPAAFGCFRANCSVAFGFMSPRHLSAVSALFSAGWGCWRRIPCF